MSHVKHVHDGPDGRLDPDIDQVHRGRVGRRLQESHFPTQLVRVIVRPRLHDEHFAVGRPILQHGRQRGFEEHGILHARYHDRESRHWNLPWTGMVMSFDEFCQCG